MNFHGIEEWRAHLSSETWFSGCKSAEISIDFQNCKSNDKERPHLQLFVLTYQIYKIYSQCKLELKMQSIYKLRV